MTSETWSVVDQYVIDRIIPADPVLDAALAASAAADLPEIQVSVTQGKLLYLLAQVHGARSILEVGTLGGYSTIWLARALPATGRLVTLEVVEKHAEVARENLKRAGLASLVDFRVGPAIDTLSQLTGPFDLTFIDADKKSTTEYFDWAVRLSRPGSVIIVDNIVRDGGLVDETSEDESVLGMRRFLDALAHDRRVDSTVIQTVGAKGYDGFAISRVLAGG